MVGPVAAARHTIGCGDSPADGEFRWSGHCDNGMIYFGLYGKTLMDLPPGGPCAAPPPDSKTGPTRFDVANRLFLRLYQTSNLLHKTGTRAVGDFGATTQQWAVLGALSRPAFRDQGMTVKDLIAFLMVSRQNLSAVLDRLECAGLVERVRSAETDGRLRHVRLTPEGGRVWSAMQPSIRVYYGDALASFPAEESLLLFQLLDKLRDALVRIGAEQEGRRASAPAAITRDAIAADMGLQETRPSAPFGGEPEAMPHPQARRRSVTKVRQGGKWR